MSCFTGLNLDAAQFFDVKLGEAQDRLSGTNIRKKVEQQVRSTRDGQQFCKL